MRNNNAESPNNINTPPSAAPEIDYSPKTHTLREQIVFGIKTAAFFGILFLLFWLMHFKK